MIRRPPRSTRTDTLFPYTTLFRSRIDDNFPMTIHLKTPEEIEKMREAGRLAAEVLQVVAPHVKPGVTTEELDRICHEHIVNVQQATPANAGYRGYPKATCIPFNNHLSHCIPHQAKTRHPVV